MRNNEMSDVPVMPKFENCSKDIDFIMKYLKIANDKQLSIIHKNIERIFLYGA